MTMSHNLRVLQEQGAWNKTDRTFRVSGNNGGKVFSSRKEHINGILWEQTGGELDSSSTCHHSVV